MMEATVRYPIWQEIVTYICLHLIILISLIQKLNHTMSNRLKDQAVFQQLAHVSHVRIHFQATNFSVIGIARSLVFCLKANRSYLLPRLSKDNEYKLIELFEQCFYNMHD